MEQFNEMLLYLNSKEDEKIIRHIELLTSGQLKKLKAVDANSLVEKLLQAIIVDDEIISSIHQFKVNLKPLKSVQDSQCQNLSSTSPYLSCVLPLGEKLSS